MNRIGAAPGAPSAILLCFALIGVAPIGTARAAPAEFIYHAQARDTLIGLGRRLLLEPKRWRDLQRLNHIADPRRIPQGALLRIPYEWLRTRAEAASVANLSGSVKTAQGPVAKGDVLPQGSVVRTGSDGSVTLDLADGSVVTLQKSSSLELDQMMRITGVDAAHSIRLKLDGGRVETAVKPHGDVGRFEIITPVAVSAVRGTRFRDGFDGGNQATTETLEGTVGVTGGAASVPVPAGFGTRVERDQPPLPPVALLPPPDPDLAQTNGSALLRVQWRPVNGAKSYRVQVSPDAEFHAISADAVTMQPAASIAGLPDGEYWLRARAIDGFGIEGRDAVRRFTQHTLPEPPVPVAPTASTPLTGTHARFEWAGAGSGARYVLQVARDSAFSPPMIERKPLDAAFAELDDMRPGRYFWRVASVNARGETGPWSTTESYAQRAAMPMPDVPRAVQKQLQFHWQGVAGESYRAQISHDANFKSVVLDRRLDAPEFSTPTPSPGHYYVRVQGIDPDGSAGPFGPSRRFVSPVPLWVKIAAPLTLLLPLLL